MKVEALKGQRPHDGTLKMTPAMGQAAFLSTGVVSRLQQLLLNLDATSNTPPPHKHSTERQGRGPHTDPNRIPTEGHGDEPGPAPPRKWPWPLTLTAARLACSHIALRQSFESLKTQTHSR